MPKAKQLPQLVFEEERKLTRAERLAEEGKLYAEWDARRPACCSNKMVWQPADQSFYCPKCRRRIKEK